MATEGEDGRRGGVSGGALIRDARVPAGVDISRLARAVLRHHGLLQRNRRHRHGLVHLLLA